VIPAVLLVVVLPVAVWHLFGDQADHSDSSQTHFIWRAPGWLNELAHPIGLVAARTAFAAVLVVAVISAGLSLGIAAAKTVASPSKSLSVNESINLSLFFLPPCYLSE